MKKLILSALLMLALSLPVMLGATDYDKIPPQSLPVFTGNINDPAVRTVYEKDGYLYVVTNGVLYVYKIN